MALVVRVDAALCHGAGACVRRAPGTFSLSAERRSIVAEHPRDDEAAIRAAANACPYFAIEVGETDDVLPDEALD